MGDALQRICNDYADITTLLTDYFKIFEQAPHQLTQFFKDKCYGGWPIEIDEDNHFIFNDRKENPFCESTVTLIPSKDLGFIVNSKLILKSENLNVNDHSGIWFPTTEKFEDYIEKYKCQKIIDRLGQAPGEQTVNENNHPIISDGKENPLSDSKITVMPSKELYSFIKSNLNPIFFEGEENSGNLFPSIESSEDFIEPSKSQKIDPISDTNYFETALKLTTIFSTVTALCCLFRVIRGNRNPGNFITFAISTAAAAASYKMSSH